MRTQSGRRRAALAACLACLAWLVTLAGLAAGCGGGTPPRLPHAGRSATPVPTTPTDAWGRLAARVAAAQDKRYTATYQLTRGGSAPRTVTVTVALDGSWLVGVPGGALGGTADVAVASSAAGLYQCLLGPAPAGLAPASLTPGCVRVAGPLPASADPRVEHIFTDWLAVLADRKVALSVDDSPPLPGAAGACFSVEASSASLAAPVDPGIYCFDPDGTLTAARLRVGTLLLSGAPASPPQTVGLPAPVVAGEPVPTAAPPQPPAPPSPSASGSLEPPPG